METYNNLEIGGERNALIELISMIKTYLPEPWVYKAENVAHYSKNTSKSIDEILCVESPVVNSKKGLVWMRLWEGVLKVINIVPTEPGQLKYHEYNAILETFFEECVKPVANVGALDILYENQGIDIKEITGEATFNKMLLWEESCNHSTGNIHSSDFDSWADFVITAHKEESKLSPGLFQRWLVEEKGWNNDADITQRLVLEYEYSRDLLKQNDKYQYT